MREALRKFVLTTRSADVRLIYFAGHGLQLRGRSYLLPVDVKINNETHVLERTADATELVEQLSAIENGANVVIIDACRSTRCSRRAPARCGRPNQGLSKVTAPTGTVVAFSTRPGQIALDGDGAVSVYTRHLTQRSRKSPELPVEVFFKRVRAGVVAETQTGRCPGRVRT